MADGFYRVTNKSLELSKTIVSVDAVYRNSIVKEDGLTFFCQRNMLLPNFWFYNITLLSDKKPLM